MLLACTPLPPLSPPPPLPFFRRVVLFLYNIFPPPSTPLFAVWVVPWRCCLGNVVCLLIFCPFGCTFSGYYTGGCRTWEGGAKKGTEARIVVVGSGCTWPVAWFGALPLCHNPLPLKTHRPFRRRTSCVISSSLSPLLPSLLSLSGCRSLYVPVLVSIK